MNLYNCIISLFGEERATLYRVEIQYLVDNGYNEGEIKDFLEEYALPIGVFYALSMLRRSRLDIKNLKKSLFFLFNRHITVAEIITKHLEPNCRILDFGCGRGLLSCFLAKKNFEVYGVDTSPDAIAIAGKLAEKLGCKPIFRLIKGNNLPFVNEYFDAISCVWTLHEISHKELQKTFEELYRVLRKKGSIFIIDQKEVAPFEIIKTYMSQYGFKLDLEENLSPAYDHGKTSQALLLKYIK